MKFGYGWFKAAEIYQPCQQVSDVQAYNVCVGETWGKFVCDLHRKECDASPETEKDGIPAQLLFIQDQLLSHCV